MKKYRFIFVLILVVTLVFSIVRGTYLATAKLTPDEVYNKYASQLSGQKEGQLDDWVAYMHYGMYQEYYDLWINAPGVMGMGADNIVTEILLNEGYYTEYVDHLREAGIIRADYQLPSEKKSSGGSATATETAATATSTATLAPITTEKCTEKTMWAKAAVNMRENGSTDYKKVGSLKAGEQVTVTGIDSTGWYEIKKADGTVGHVSDKYLTEVDPSVSTSAKVETPEETPTAIPASENKIISIDGRTVVWYNAETGQEETVTFGDSIPLDEIEQYADTYLIHGGELVEETPEPTLEPTAEPTAAPTKKPKATVEPTVVPTEKPTVEQRLINSPVYWVVGLAACVALIIGGVVMVRSKRK